MEERIFEGIIPNAKDIVPLNQTEFKSKAKCICKILGYSYGTGFFSKIIYEGKLIPVLITNYHVIDDNFIRDNKELKIYINGDCRMITLKNRKIYSSVNDKYDIMILKLKDEDEINNYLEIDQNIFKHNSENSYRNEPIYILHFPEIKESSVSYGIGIEKLDDYDIKHLCNTKKGSSGGPILSSLTDKVIGIHKRIYQTENGMLQYWNFLKISLK